MIARNHIIKFIKATTEYLDELEKLEIESFGINAYSRHILKNLIKNSDFFIIALYRNKVIGYLCGEIRNGEGHLKSVAVEKTYRDKGIGSEMLSRFEDYLSKQEIHEIYLEVSVENEIAIRFYIKRGYEIKRKIPNFYINGEDAYIMHKNI